MARLTPASAGIFGWPIAHSKSPVIHRFWLGKLGIDGDYSRFPVSPEKLGAAVKALPAMGLRGVNVTVPHKQAVMAHLDRIDPLAEKIGAVNTVVVEDDGGLAGYNTDAAGFLEPLRPLLAERHLYRIARILGAGGASRAVAHALWSEGFDLVIAARDVGKARSLRAEFDAEDNRCVDLAHFGAPTDFAFDDRKGILDLVVNTTPLGMKGQPPLPFDFSHAPPGAVFYDAVYAPLETELLAGARARGHQVIDGLAMLIGQAALAFELFYGAPAPRQFDAELRAILTA